MLSKKYDAVWLLYSRRPRGQLPRRWKGLVGYGRLDIVARAILASNYVSPSIDSDSALLLYLDDEHSPQLIYLEPKCMPSVMKYEHESAQFLLEVLRGRTNCLVENNPPTLVGLAKRFSSQGYKVVQLIEEGKLLTEHVHNTLYILGTHIDPPILEKIEKRSIGPFSYLTSHVIAYINIVLRKKLLGT